MKAVTTLIFLITLLIQITTFAQSEVPQASERNIPAELSALSETIDLYFEETIALKSKLSGSNLKITSPNLSEEDAEKTKFLKETRENISSALKLYKAEITSELGNNPESLEALESSKLLYNIAIIKAILPRFETPKTGLLKKILSSGQAQYAEEIIPRAEALNLIFTQFDSNEPTKDAMNAEYRLNEMIKAHNKLAEKVNQQKEAKIYQIYPTNLKITTAAQEATLYQSIVKGEEYKAPTQLSMLMTVKTGPDSYSIVATCAGLFGI